MRNKKKLITMLSISIIIISGLIWWNIPSSIISIQPSEVSKIGVFDGNTGKTTTIINMIDIEHIIKNLNSVSLKKEKISFGYMGYSFKITIYKLNGDIYKKFIINSSNTIRKDPFFYRDSSESIDYDYIQKLIQNNEAADNALLKVVEHHNSLAEVQSDYIFPITIKEGDTVAKEVNIGGPSPGATVILEMTVAIEKEDDEYLVILTEDYNITVNGKDAISYWKYKVSADEIMLLDKKENGNLIRIIK
ncbi:MAG: hypothetical protein AB7V16_09285 [Vulcanibacillus sp.]